MYTERKIFYFDCSAASLFKLTVKHFLILTPIFFDFFRFVFFIGKLDIFFKFFHINYFILKGELYVNITFKVIQKAAITVKNSFLFNCSGKFIIYVVKLQSFSVIIVFYHAYSVFAHVQKRYSLLNGFGQHAF